MGNIKFKIWQKILIIDFAFIVSYFIFFIPRRLDAMTKRHCIDCSFLEKIRYFISRLNDEYNIDALYYLFLLFTFFILLTLALAYVKKVKCIKKDFVKNLSYFYLLQLLIITVILMVAIYLQNGDTICFLDCYHGMPPEILLISLFPDLIFSCSIVFIPVSFILSTIKQSRKNKKISTNKA